MTKSARRQAKRNMDLARTAGSRARAGKPPWPSPLRNAARRLFDAAGSPAGLPISVAILTAVLVAVTYMAPAHVGRTLANNGFLSTLWQVQAAAVSLALALAVFVFGLLPRSGKRVSYRAFLRRSSARWVVVLGIASMLLDGVVLLGFGHQKPNTPGTSDGHGWAVTVAGTIGLLSVASIAVLFGRTIGAIDPDAGASALTSDRRVVVGDALRKELFGEFAYDAIAKAARSCGFEFLPGFYRDGRQVLAPQSGGTVHDVVVRRVARIGKRAQAKNRAQPVVHVWPGQRLVSAVPMVTVAVSTPWIDRVRARRCVRVRKTPADEASVLLDALHADVLEHIRADRPIDALAGMEAMREMLGLAWQADQAHQHAPEGTADLQRTIFRMRGFKDQVTRRLNAEVRAGAVSADEQIRAQTATFPRQLAVLAMQEQAAESVRACLALYPPLYEAVVSDVTEAGRLPIPQSGVGRRRITQVFAAVLSFSRDDVLRSLDRARRTRPVHADPQWTPAELNVAVFAVAQSTVANSQILTMLRKALAFGDILTVQQVLPGWSAPDADWLRSAEQAANEPDGSGGALAGLENALETQRSELAGMKLRLLRTALHLERRNQSGSIPGTEPGESLPADPDPAVLALLGGQDPETFWAALTTATQQADQDIFPEARDDEVRPDGWHMTGLQAESPSLAETFVLATFARPQLAAGGEPDLEYALDHATDLVGAVSGVLAARLPWAEKYGAEGDLPAQAQELIGRIQKANARARREAARRELAVPIPDTAEPTLREAVARQYAAHDVISPLFAWARRPALVGSPPASAPLSVGQRWERRTFTDPGADMEYASEVLGKSLAHYVIGELLAQASARQVARPVSPQDLAHRTRLAITALRRVRTGVPGLDPDAPGIVVIVPTEGVTADLLDLTDLARGNKPSDAAANPSVRDQALAQLDFDTRQLEWFLLGLVGTVPVLRHPLDIRRVIVLDLAYGIEYSARGGVGAQVANLSAVTLLPESEESARRRYAPSPGNASTEAATEDPSDNVPDERVTRDMTMVGVKMDLAVAFTVDSGIGVRLLEVTTG